MARKFSCFLLLLCFNENRAQTGAGCFSPTCSTPGQVRMDAIIENGQFVGGCNCACHPDLYNPLSPMHCPNYVNFDARTLSGDCSCGCDPNNIVDPKSCTFPRTYDADSCGCKCPSWTPPPQSCRAPTEFVPDMCQCQCPNLGSVGGPCLVKGQYLEGSRVLSDCTCDTSKVPCPGNQEMDLTTKMCQCPLKSASGAWFPSCIDPTVRDPLTCDCVLPSQLPAVLTPNVPSSPSSPSVPINNNNNNHAATLKPIDTRPKDGPVTVDCTQSGDCSCPMGTRGPCTIRCIGADDACKDGLISCNNDGFDCTVHCLADSGCAGSAMIKGPERGQLEVNCIGRQACEGSVVIDNKKGTDTVIVCQGGASCKGSVVFEFGMGKSLVECNGRPDACYGSVEFALIPGAESMSGAAFDCTGICPSHVPAPFNNIPGAVAPSEPVVVRPSPEPQPLPFPVFPSPSKPSNPSPFVPIEPVVQTPAPTLFVQPTLNPTFKPTLRPTLKPTDRPTPKPTMYVEPSQPTPKPTYPIINMNIPPLPSPRPTPKPVISNMNNIPVNTSPFVPINPIAIDPITNNNNNNQINPDPSQYVPIDPPQPVTAAVKNTDTIIPAIRNLPGPEMGTVIGAQAVMAIRVPDEIIVCDTPSCQCSNTAPCTIQCIPTFLVPEACANALMICPKDFACTVLFKEGAGGGAVVTAPVGHDLTVTCEGAFSCGNTNFVAAYANAATYAFLGEESGMGASINCGTGHCKVDCSGSAACDGAPIAAGVALSFDCYGATAQCPMTYTAAPVPVPTWAPTPPCNALSDCPCDYPNCFEQRDPVTCQCQCPIQVLLAAHRNDPTICGADNNIHSYIDSACACGCPASTRPFGGCPGGQEYNEFTCQCGCPNSVECKGASVLNPNTCQCECPPWAPRASDCLAINKVLRDCECACPIPCPGSGQIQSLSGCQCGCPSTTPDPVTCASGFIDELSCECAVPLPSDHCCLTTIPNFTPFAGWCWGHQNPTACNAVPDQKCTWNAASCLPSPPVNTIDRTKPCYMRDEPCARDGDCCSEVCRTSGFCR